jgi:ubiquinone/menaquinone biosynthesis C-methylase UbiE
LENPGNVIDRTWGLWYHWEKFEGERSENMEITELLAQYYGDYDEEGRLEKRRWGQVEYITTMHYLKKYLRPGDRVLEIGAGTGRYSVTLAGEGYDVTAVELVPHNLEILRSKVTDGMKIQTIQANALDLSMLPDESFHLTLLLGPMYHLFDPADKRRAISEALRVTKKGGVVMVAYCVTDGPMLNFVFRLNRYQELVEQGILDSERFTFRPGEAYLFDHITKPEIDRLMEGFPVERLHYVATDGLPSFLRQELEEMEEETFQALLRYHLSVCERPDLAGATAHSLDIFRKA